MDHSWYANLALIYSTLLWAFRTSFLRGKPSQTLYNLTNPLQLFVLLCKPEGRCVLVFPSCCSYLVDRWTLTRAMERGPMISVTWDQSLDEAAFRPQDEDDPRSMGTWPCGLAHQPPIVSEGSNLPYPVEWLQNEHFRAASCPRCALVLGYWPRVGHGGSYFIRPHSDVVREALREVRRDNPNDTTAQIVRAKILEVQLRWGHQAAASGRPWSDCGISHLFLVAFGANGAAEGTDAAASGTIAESDRGIFGVSADGLVGGHRGVASCLCRLRPTARRLRRILRRRRVA